MDFDLSRFLINKQDSVTLTASFDPNDAQKELTFDPDTGKLTGTIPPASSPNDHVQVTFTAYSHITHSTSHSDLVIAFSANQKDDPNAHLHPSSLSIQAKQKLVLGLASGFGAIGVLILLIGFLACFRRCARVEDTALQGEAVTKAYTDNERAYYDIDLEKGPEQKSNGSSFLPNPFEPGTEPSPPQASAIKRDRYATLGHGQPNDLAAASTSNATSAGLAGRMSKSEFVTRLGKKIHTVSRDTARNVSDKYTAMRQRVASGPRTQARPKISKPILPIVSDPLEPSPPLPFQSQVDLTKDPFADRFVAMHGSGGEMSIQHSPSSSTDSKSLKRKSDLRIADRHTRRSNKRDSEASLVSHAAEAVVHTASRATSVKSARSGSAISQASEARVVPFTKASRVKPAYAGPSKHDPSAGPGKRVVSQHGTVFEGEEDMRLGQRYMDSMEGGGGVAGQTSRISEESMTH